MKSSQNCIFLATTALAFSFTASSFAETETQIDDAGMGTIALGDALRDLDIVNSQGDHLGNITDFVIDFDESRLLYTLISADGGVIENGENGNARYPFPISALQLVDVDVLQADDEQEEPEEAENSNDDTNEEAEQADAGNQDMDMGIDPGLVQMTAGDIVGIPVYTEDEEHISDVEEIILYNDVPEFILGVGGFLGIGESKIAIPASEFSYDASQGELLIAMTEDEIGEQPEAEYDDAAIVPEDMTLAEAMGYDPDAVNNDTDAEARADTDANGDTDEANETDADDGEANGNDEQAEADHDGQLDGKVLLLDVTAEELANAPSFVEGDFPDVENPEWHQAIISFYEEILGTDGMGHTDPADNDQEMNQDQN